MKMPRHHHCVLLLRSPIRRFGSGPAVVAPDTLLAQELEPAHSPACSPNAGAVGAGAARAGMRSVPVVTCDVPVAAEDVDVDKVDTRSVEAAAAAAMCHMRVEQEYCFDNMHWQYLQGAGQGQWDQRSYAH